MSQPAQNWQDYQDGEDVDMDPGHLRAIGRMMEEASGNVFPESKNSLIQSRVLKRMIHLNITSFDDYVTYLGSKNGTREKEELIFTLTTNTTRFFREPHHFKELRETRIPQLVQRARAGERIRIWSAGCSSGEEPYSIAMIALSLEPEIAKYDFKILATDLDRNMTSKARRGVYPASKLATIPSDLHRFIDQKDDTLHMSTRLKELISYRELNLLHEWPFRGSFDIIFCRNVVIYFSEEISDQLWRKFAARLVSAGRLFIGHSERVRAPESMGLSLNGITAYTKQ